MFNLFLAATIANFEEEQHLHIKFEPELISEAEHLSLRFKVNYDYFDVFLLLVHFLVPIFL